MPQPISTILSSGQSMSVQPARTGSSGSRIFFIKSVRAFWGVSDFLFYLIVVAPLGGGAEGALVLLVSVQETVDSLHTLRDRMTFIFALALAAVLLIRLRKREGEAADAPSSQ